MRCFEPLFARKNRGLSVSLQHPAIYTTQSEMSSQNIGEIEETVFFPTALAMPGV
jgi:hypothetical protein